MNSISSCPHFVYELVDPRDNSIFYVGITINLYERYKQHIQCDGINPQKDVRIQEILEAGHLPFMRRREYVESFEEARKRENWWLWHYRVSGIELLNIAVPPKMKYIGLHANPVRERAPREAREGAKERTYIAVIDMLVSVRETRKWPDGISPQMQRYYKRKYPEFFHGGRRYAKIRDEKIEKANRLRA